MAGLTTNLKLQSVFVGKSGLDTGITESFKIIANALGISLPVRTEGIEALKASYAAGIKRIEAKLGIRLPIDVNGMYGFQANVAANFRMIDAAIAGGAVTPVPNLDAITLSQPLKSDIPSSGLISNATPGSVISTSVPGMTINGLEYSFDGSAPPASYAITETMVGAANSPRITSIIVQSVTGGGSWGGPGIWGGGGSWGSRAGNIPIQIFAFGTRNGEPGEGTPVVQSFAFGIRDGEPSEDAGAVQKFAFGMRNDEPGESTPAVQNFFFGTATTTPSE